MTPELGRLLRTAAGLPGDTPLLDAELLLAHAAGMDRAGLLLGGLVPGADALARFEALLARRRAHEPVAYILGFREFWSLPLGVTPDVLIPRPDSETLIEAAMAARRGRPPATVLDLGTGSGALLLAALTEWPGAWGLGVDRSEAAVRVAAANAARLRLAAHFLVADWAAPIAGRFDLVLCNPPYVPAGAALMPDVVAFEPAAALFAGADGLDCYRRLLPEVPRLLAPGGVALFEFGEGQAGPLPALAAAAGLAADVRCDLAGRPRVLVLAEPARRFGLVEEPAGG